MLWQNTFTVSKYSYPRQKFNGISLPEWNVMRRRHAFTSLSRVLVKVRIDRREASSWNVTTTSHQRGYCAAVSNSLEGKGRIVPKQMLRIIRAVAAIVNVTHYRLQTIERTVWEAIHELHYSNFVIEPLRLTQTHISLAPCTTTSSLTLLLAIIVLRPYGVCYILSSRELGTFVLFFHIA